MTNCKLYSITVGTGYKDIGVEAKTEPKVLFCNYYVA